MGPITSIAKSGMNAAQYSLGISAHNIANSSTANFRPLEAVQQTQESGGVSVSVKQAPIAQVTGSTMTNDLVQQMVTSYVFKANTVTLQTEQKMMGTLLNIGA